MLLFKTCLLYVEKYKKTVIKQLVFKIKDKLELQMPGTMTLFWSKKKLTDKTNREKVPSLEIVEEVLIQCNLVDNQSLIWKN